MIVERQSIVDALSERVWARVVTPEGINDELRPWMTMSMPRGRKSLTVDDIPVGTPVGRCWTGLQSDRAGHTVPRQETLPVGSASVVRLLGSFACKDTSARNASSV